MQVSDNTGIAIEYVDNSTRATTQRLDTRNPFHYSVVCFDGIGDFLLAHAYDERQPEIAGMLEMLASTGTGANVLADVRALSGQGVRIAIGPDDGRDPDSDHVDVHGVSTTVNGNVLWDCYHGHGRDAEWGRAPIEYRRLIAGLALARNLAVERAWPGVPPLQRKDVESAFMAELALRTAPAVAESEFVPSFPVRLEGLDPQYMPDWDRGPLHFDTLDGLMPAWFTEAGKPCRDEVLAVLRKIQRTDIGQRLLTDLWVYGRSRAVMVIHRSAQGRDHVQKLDDGTAIWSFNNSTLARLAADKELGDSDARASGAFVKLLAARRMLVTQLGMLQKNPLASDVEKFAETLDMQRQFEHELELDRHQSPRMVGAVSSPVVRSHFAVGSPGWHQQKCVGGRYGLPPLTYVNTGGPALSTSDDERTPEDNVSGPATPSTSPVEAAMPSHTAALPRQPGAETANQKETAQRPHTPQSHQKPKTGVGRLLEVSAQLLARPFSSTSSMRGVRVPDGPRQIDNPRSKWPAGHPAGDRPRQSDI